MPLPRRKKTTHTFSFQDGFSSIRSEDTLKNPYELGCLYNWQEFLYSWENGLKIHL